MGGRSEEFNRLVDERSASLLRSAYLLTCDWSLAEDLLQTALARTWFKWGSLRDVGAAEAYVRTTMARTFASWWRRRWRGEIPTEYVPDSADGDPYASYDDRDGLLRALAGLAPRARAMIILRYFDDMTDLQIADALNCSESTVRSTVSRALAKLRESVRADLTMTETT